MCTNEGIIKDFGIKEMLCGAEVSASARCGLALCPLGPLVGSRGSSRRPASQARQHTWDAGRGLRVQMVPGPIYPRSLRVHN